MSLDCEVLRFEQVFVWHAVLRGRPQKQTDVPLLGRQVPALQRFCHSDLRAMFDNALTLYILT